MKFLASGAYASLLGILCSAPLWSQLAMKGQNGLVRIQNTDLAVFEAGEDRRDLPCVVTPDKPFLGFDLRFHSGFDVAVPLRELSGSENLLTILFRVTPDARKDDAMYFIQRVKVPSIEEDAKGDAVLQGSFDLGEGKYRVDWLMRDRSERVCSHFWDSEATLPSRDKQISVRIPPGSIEQTPMEQFQEDPPVERTSTDPLLNVKVLLNFAPQKATAATLRPLDSAALISILRSLNREPRIGKFSLVAFNLQEQRVFFRQDGADRIDFRRLGESINTLNLGTVELRHLAQKNSETAFLTDLIGKEFPKTGDRPDAVVFAGPKAMLGANVPDDSLKQLGDLEYPVFYMNYILNPNATPWRDAIGNAVKALKGTEYTISRPRDLWFAVTEMVSRIVKFRNGKQVAAVSSN